MKILSMTATFGKLEHETLTLQPGLNILQADNEWGKSTWCAFMVAMLYGIDTRQQTTKAGLADKERYAPWSGAPMSGRMDILWNGRAITLERSGKPRAPFGQFRAYETASGNAVAELTAENCGRQLLGVEKEVFLRSGFLRLSDLPLGSSEALRRRLNALVTTGDESGDGAALEQKLNKLKNDIYANRSKGLLPQARAQLEEVTGVLETIQALNHRQAALEQQRKALTEAGDALQQRQALRQQRQEELLAAQQALQQLPPQPQLPPSPLPSCDDPAAQLAAVRQKRILLRENLKKPFPLWAWLALLAALAAVLYFLHPLAALAALLPLPFPLMKHSRYRRTVKELAALEAFPEAEVARYCAQRRDILSRRQAWQAQKDALTAQVQALQASLPPSQEEALAENRRSLQALQLQLGACQGQLALLGQPDSLRARRDALLARCKELEQTLRAVELARQTLAKATAQLQSRFAPRINKRSQALFSRLTEGRYDRLTLTDSLTVETAAQGEDTLRTPLWRSDGTADQLYLAVRLAVAAELAPHAPFILDDALVRFDDRRLAAALQLLQEESDQRQILLFTCQSREAALLKGD